MTVNEMCASPQGPPLDYSFLGICLPAKRICCDFCDTPVLVLKTLLCLSCGRYGATRCLILATEIRIVEELREVLPRSGFRKQPPDFLEDESGQQVANPIKVSCLKC
jgi:hypothetical protein